MRMPQGLVTRLLIAQLAVVGVAGLALIATAAIVGPRLFTEHLRHTGESSPLVISHAEEAFASSFAIALAVSLLMALITAGLVALLVVRRIAASVTDLADAADAIAAGDYAVTVPSGGFGTEMTRLSAAFARMAQRLAATEAARTGMLADLSHELRTPLATLEAYIDGMEDQVVPAEPASYAVMRDQVGRLRRLAVDVREASAAEEHALSLHPEPVDPRDLARSAVEFARPSYQAKGVELSLTSRGPGLALRRTPPGCSRSWATCWPTRCVTPLPAGGSPSESKPHTRARSASRSLTRGRGSRSTSWRRSSPGSTAPTNLGPATTAAARAWG